MEVEQMQHCEIRNKHRVERAIIMAAGTGTRMRPVTLDTPKPLIRVNGVRMIDTVIRALQENGIFEIYVCKFCPNGTPILKLAVHPF